METAFHIVSSIDWITWCILAATLIIGFWPERGYVWRLITDSTTTPDELPPVWNVDNVKLYRLHPVRYTCGTGVRTQWLQATKKQGDQMFVWVYEYKDPNDQGTGHPDFGGWTKGDIPTNQKLSWDDLQEPQWYAVGLFA